MNQEPDLPSITIVSPIHNPKKVVLKRVLDAIDRQDYPKSKIEHLLLSWKTPSEIKSFAKKYGCKVITLNKIENTEHRKSLGLQKAKHELVLFLNVDNIMTNNKYLRNLAEPFIFEKKLVGSFPLHFGYRSRMGFVDRYCALFGVADPVVLYLKKNDRQPWYVEDFNQGQVIKRKNNYAVVNFDFKTLPTVGDNGHLVDKKIILKSKDQNEKYLHIDSFVDVLNQGYKKFAVVKGTEVEHIVSENLLDLARRRSLYMSYFSPLKYKRSYLTFNPRSINDILNLFLFVVFTLTVVQPLTLSIRGFLKIKDVAWFLHPIACFVFLVYYSKTYSALIAGSLAKRL